MTESAEAAAVTAAETKLADLEAKHTAAQARRVQVDEQFTELGLAAFGDDDAGAKKKFAQLNTESFTLDNQIKGLAGAVVGARRRLAEALEAKRNAAERVLAEEVRKRVKDLRAEGVKLDNLLREAMATFTAVKADISELGLLTDGRPSPALVRSAADRALVAHLQPFGMVERMAEFGRLRPSEMHTFEDVVEKWLVGFSIWADRILSDEKEAA